jgi:hypothetical protein
MKLFTKSIHEIDEISDHEFNQNIIFHCYWNGSISKKQLYSIKSCYYFNVYKKKSRKIILWLDKKPQKPVYNHIQKGLYIMKSNQFVTENNILNEIEKFAEIRIFDFNKECENLFHTDVQNNITQKLSNLTTPPLYADLVRLLLLYKHGGVWFDLDCFFLRDFSPLFSMFQNDIVTYRWENENYPNNAIIISVIPKSEKILDLITFLNNTKTFSFQENLFFHDNIDMIVLPCEYFDPIWTLKDQNKEFFFRKTENSVDFSNFFPHSFCYHWHNLWSFQVEQESPFSQLCNLLDHLLTNSL